MTWSIVARDPETGLLGIAIASRFFAVGAQCPWTRAGVGAVSTQAMLNPTLGPRALELMRDGYPVEIVMEMIEGLDKGIEARQIHFIDAQGKIAARTGSKCIDWCGDAAGDGVSVAGNMLAGPDVVGDTLKSYLDNLHEPFVERLIAAMKAGEAAGGDKRGKQAAAVVIQGAEPYTRLDIRVDDHVDPLEELERLYEVAKERSIPFSVAYPTRERPYGITDRDYLEGLIEQQTGKPLGIREI
ncbi:MAG: DUF1028 domain-containing protein [Hyphomicrobiaceae bacterium]|nr:DUF1028 domain-containing protein [Hyphomicrobiaceae bacterium]